MASQVLDKPGQVPKVDTTLEILWPAQRTEKGSSLMIHIPSSVKKQCYIIQEGLQDSRSPPDLEPKLKHGVL